MPYEMLIACGIFVICVPILLWGADKQIKYFKELNLRDIIFVNVTKSRYFLIFYKRRERLISKTVLLCNIAYYLLNIIAIILLAIYFAVRLDALFITSCSLFFGNLVIFIVLMINISSSEKERQIIIEDQQRRKTKQKGEK